MSRIFRSASNFWSGQCHRKICRNGVAATVMPKEMKSLTINVATVNPKEILSRACSISFVCFSSHMDQSEYGVLLAFCCNRPILLFNERKEFFFIAAIKKVETFT